MKMIRFLLLVLLFPLSGFGQAFPEKPTPPRLVNDFTNTLSPQDLAALESKLVAYNDSTSTQIAIVMLSSLDGYPIDEYSFQLAEKWGIGQKGKNNGVLVLVAKDDRKIFIATGYGMEGVMPDGLVKRIVENDIKPYFKQGDYFGGLDNGTNSMFRLAAGEYKADARSRSSNDKSPLVFILIFIFFAIIAMALKVRSVQKYAIVNNIAFWAAWELLNQSRRIHHGSWGGFTGHGGGSWGGSGGSSGFGGFGGGSFGGGGAGGSW